jgi:hypothetical protein
MGGVDRVEENRAVPHTMPSTMEVGILLLQGGHNGERFGKGFLYERAERSGITTHESFFNHLCRLAPVVL